MERGRRGRQKRAETERQRRRRIQRRRGRGRAERGKRRGEVREAERQSGDRKGGETEREDRSREGARGRGGESGRAGWGERRRGGFHRAQAGGCQSRSIAHTVPRACPASASPECPPSGLNSAAHARFSACKTQEGRSGGVGGGLSGRGNPGRARGLALPPPLDGTEDPGREKIEGGHREAGPGPAHQARPPSAWGWVRGWRGHTAHRWGWGRGGTTELKTEPKKGRKNEIKNKIHKCH